MPVSSHPDWDNVPSEEIPFPIGPEDNFYDWMLARFELPPDTPITHRFFRAMRVLELPAEWYQQHQIEEDMGVRWRTRLAQWMSQGQGAGQMPEQWHRYPLSALGYHAFTSRIWKIYQEVPSRAAIRDYYHEKYGPLVAVELLLRRDIEIRGRARVAQSGAAPYLALLHQAPDVSAHEALETVKRWHQSKLFEPRDAEFCARFPQILASHELWIADRRQGKRAVLCGRDLREVSWPKGALRGADLRGALLRNLDLNGEDLRDCDLRWADLTATRLVGCRWSGANLDEALLGLALVKDVGPLWMFRHINLWPTLARMLRNSLSVKSQVGWGTDFSDCDLSGRDLQQYNGDGLNGLNFSDCDLRGADLSCGVFSNYYSGCCFDGADLRGANVWAAKFNGCSFRGANLDGILHADCTQWDDNPPHNRDWRGVKMRGVKLCNYNFSDCDFSGADLRGCNLSYANFSGAILRDADLRGARLDKTQLKDADLTGARVSKKTLKKANFE